MIYVNSNAKFCINNYTYIMWCNFIDLALMAIQFYISILSTIAELKMLMLKFKVANAVQWLP
jgi:hypothetical protein